MGHNVTLCFFAAALVLGAYTAKTPYDCDFEKGQCGWIATQQNFQHFWKRVQGGNPASGTGPTHDDSGRVAGYFLNLRTIKDKANYKAYLGSPSMKSYATSSSCKLHFSYSMHVEYPNNCENSLGSGCNRFTGSATITKQVCDGSNKQFYTYMETNCAKVCGIHCGKLSVVADGPVKEEIFTVGYKNNMQWTKQVVSIPSKFTGTHMEIIFEATTGGDFNAFTALDSIYFTGCNLTPPTTLPPTTTPTTTTTTPTTTTTIRTTPLLSSVKPEMYDCHFEKNSMCGFTSRSKTWNWVVNSQGTPSTGTGPPKDGSGSTTGHYAVMSITKGRIIDTARLISPLIDQFKYSPKCYLNFMYNVFSPSFYYCTNQDGAKCDQYQRVKDTVCESQPSWANNHCSRLCGVKCTNLKVYVTNDMKNLGNTVFHIRTPVNDQWYTAHIPIGNITNNDFRVVFEVLSGYDANSYVALDSITFTDCETKIPPLTTTTITPPTTSTITPPSTTIHSTLPITTTTSTSSAPPPSVMVVQPSTASVNVAANVAGTVKGTTAAGPSLSIPVADEQAANKEQKSANVLGIALGVVGAVVVAVIIIAVATYMVRKKKSAERSPSVSPLKEAWK